MPHPIRYVYLLYYKLTIINDYLGVKISRNFNTPTSQCPLSPNSVEHALANHAWYSGQQHLIYYLYYTINYTILQRVEKRHHDILQCGIITRQI